MPINNNTEYNSEFSQLGFSSKSHSDHGGNQEDLAESFHDLAKALQDNTKAQVQGNETLLKQGNNSPGGGVFSLASKDLQSLIQATIKSTTDSNMVTVSQIMAKYAPPQQLPQPIQPNSPANLGSRPSVQPGSSELAQFRGMAMASLAETNRMANSFKSFAVAHNVSSPLTDAMKRKNDAEFRFGQAAAEGQAGIMNFQAQLLNGVPKPIASLLGGAGETLSTFAPALPLISQLIPKGAGVSMLAPGALAAGVVEKGREAVEIGTSGAELVKKMDTVKKALDAGVISKEDADKYGNYLNSRRQTGIVGGTEINSFISDALHGNLNDKQRAEIEKKLGFNSGVNPDSQVGMDKLKLLLNDPALKAQMGSMALSRDESAASFQNQKIDLVKNYARQVEDLERNHNRTLEDLNTSQFRFQRDNLTQLTRLNEDYQLSRQKLTVQSTRLEEDSATQSFRTQRDHMLNLRDFKIQEQRQDQDFNRASGRLDVQQGRAERDLNKQGAAIDLSASRSREDLNTSYSDSLLSILAPGAANSKGMQLIRLNRDFNKAGRRLDEDVSISRRDLADRRKDIAQDFQFEREGLGINYTRGKEDIAHSKQREQISFEDSMFDQQKSLNRARQDLAMQDLEISRSFTRNLTDLNKSLADFNQDFNKQYSRTQQDYGIAKARGLEDFTEGGRRINQAEGFTQRRQQLEINSLKASLLKDAGVMNAGYGAANSEIDKLLNSTGVYRGGSYGGNVNPNFNFGNPVFQLPPGAGGLTSQQQTEVSKLVESGMQQIAQQVSMLINQMGSRTR